MREGHQTEGLPEARPQVHGCFLKARVHPLQTSKHVVEDHDNTERRVGHDQSEVADVYSQRGQKVGVGVRKSNAGADAGESDREHDQQIYCALAKNS